MASNFQSSIGGLDMHNEWHRLSTYSHFPMAFPEVSEIHLAKAGFYRIGSRKVKCYSCGVIKSDWKYLENPFQSHLEISPNCSFVNNNDTINIPIHKKNIRPRVSSSTSNSVLQSESGLSTNRNSNSDCDDEGFAPSSHQPVSTYSSSSPTSGSSFSASANITCNDTRSSVADQSQPINKKNNFPQHNNATSENPQRVPVDDLGINFAKPRYPAYAVLAVREQTFHGWPKYLPQTPAEMARAGFIYAGYSDYTRCFFCGGGLRNWDPNDNPWVEHARWFSKCAYVRQNKGDKWVKEILQAGADHVNDLKNASTNVDQASNIKDNVGDEGLVPSSPTPSETCILSHAAVQSVLEMKYDTDIILRALNIIGKHKDIQSTSASDILETIFGIEEGTIECDLSSLSVSDKTQDPLPPKQSLTEECIADKNTNETQQILKENADLKELQICKVCRENEVSIVFLPCGHYVTCIACSQALRKCPVCNLVIHGTIKAWLA